MLSVNRSAALTHFIVRLCYVILALVSVMLPIILYKGLYDFEILGQIKEYIIGPFYAVVPAGYVALVCLDLLLKNVKSKVIFDRKNVKLLRVLSWACFYAGLVGLVSFVVILIKDFMFETLFVLSAGEFFVGLVVRVVKHVFEAAIEIKEENELTI